MLPPRFVRRLLFPPLVLLITVAAIVLSPLLLLLAVGGRAHPAGPAAGPAAVLVRPGLAGDGVPGPGGLPGPVDRRAASAGGCAPRRRWSATTVWSGGSSPRCSRRAVKVFRAAGARSRSRRPPPEELAARLTRPVIVLSRHAGPGRLVPARAPPAQPLPPPAAHRDEGGAAVRPEPGRGDQPAAARVRPSRRVTRRRPCPAVRAGPARGGVRGGPRRRAAGAGPLWSGHTPSAVVEEIRRLAGGLGPTGALVIFPEGGNFTPSRRRRGISRLEQAARLRRGPAGPGHGQPAAAPLRRRLRGDRRRPDGRRHLRGAHRPGRPHHRRRRLAGPADGAGDQGAVVAGAGRRGAARRDEVVRWLYDWWERIDAWIAENRPVRVPHLTRVMRSTASGCVIVAFRRVGVSRCFARYPGRGSLDREAASTHLAPISACDRCRSKRRALVRAIPLFDQCATRFARQSESPRRSAGCNYQVRLDGARITRV